MIADNLLLTCWHCLRRPLADGEFYAAAHWQGARYRTLRLENVAQTQTGHDLALANVEARPLANIQLSSRAVAQGTDVWSYGFPYTATRELENRGLSFELQGRYLQGYVTRGFIHRRNGYSSGPAHELDMPAPKGMSGAPLFEVGTLAVIGMVYGINDVATIEHFRRIDQVRRQPRCSASARSASPIRRPRLRRRRGQPPMANAWRMC